MEVNHAYNVLRMLPHEGWAKSVLPSQNKALPVWFNIFWDEISFPAIYVKYAMCSNPTNLQYMVHKNVHIWFFSCSEGEFAISSINFKHFSTY